MKNTLGVALGLAALLSGCSDHKKESINKQAQHEFVTVSMNAPPPASSDNAEEATADVEATPTPIPGIAVAPSRLLI